MNDYRFFQFQTDQNQNCFSEVRLESGEIDPELPIDIDIPIHRTSTERAGNSGVFSSGILTGEEKYDILSPFNQQLPPYICIYIHINKGKLSQDLAGFSPRHSSAGDRWSEEPQAFFCAEELHWSELSFVVVMLFRGPAALRRTLDQEVARSEYLFFFSSSLFRSLTFGHSSPSLLPQTVRTLSIG